MDEQDFAILIEKDWYKRILIDFDNTICTFDGDWGDGKPHGEMIDDAEKSIDKLIEMGFEIWIFTSRLSHPELPEFYRQQYNNVKEWLNNHNISFTGITGIKLPAFAYIDDRGITFTSWQHVINQILTWRSNRKNYFLFDK